MSSRFDVCPTCIHPVFDVFLGKCRASNSYYYISRSDMDLRCDFERNDEGRFYVLPISLYCYVDADDEREGKIIERFGPMGRKKFIEKMVEVKIPFDVMEEIEKSIYGDLEEIRIVWSWQAMWGHIE